MATGPSSSYSNFRGGTLPFPSYWSQIYFGMGPRPADLTGPVWPELNFGHLWFVEHLLVYAAIYAAWRLAWRRTAKPGQVERTGAAPGDYEILGYAVALTLVTLLVRTWYPKDRWLFLLGFIQTEPAHLPQYLNPSSPQGFWWGSARSFGSASTQTPPGGGCSGPTPMAPTWCMCQSLWPSSMQPVGCRLDPCRSSSRSH